MRLYGHKVCTVITLFAKAHQAKASPTYKPENLKNLQLELVKS